MGGAQDGSWGGHRFALLDMAAKLSHVEVDVNGLACYPHRATKCG
jgi:hypothetical protein